MLESMVSQSPNTYDMQTPLRAETDIDVLRINNARYRNTFMSRYRHIGIDVFLYLALFNLNFYS